jgi:hypothetical protein
MTSKIYKSAQGKVVDLGTIMLKNEHVRAVGNMGVNARGDKLDQNNRVIETKPQQIKRQNALTTNVSDDIVHSSSGKARRARQEKELAQQTAQDDVPEDTQDDVPEDTPVDTTPVDTAPVDEPISAPAPVVEDPTVNVEPPKVAKVLEGGVAAAIARQRDANIEKTGTPSGKPNEGGLAAAIARQREVKQELEKTRRQQQQSQGVRKI